MHVRVTNEESAWGPGTCTKRKSTRTDIPFRRTWRKYLVVGMYAMHLSRCTYICVRVACQAVVCRVFSHRLVKQCFAKERRKKREKKFSEAVTRNKRHISDYPKLLRARIL